MLKKKVVKHMIEFLKKLNVELPYNPTVPLQGIYYPKEVKARTQTDTCVFVYSSIIHNSQKVEEIQMSINI